MQRTIHLAGDEHDDVERGVGLSAPVDERDKYPSRVVVLAEKTAIDAFEQTPPPGEHAGGDQEFDREERKIPNDLANRFPVISEADREQYNHRACHQRQHRVTRKCVLDRAPDHEAHIEHVFDDNGVSGRRRDDQGKRGE